MTKAGLIEEEEEEDPTDIFDTSLSSLFSIPPIGFAPDHNGYFTYNPPISDDHHQDPQAIKLRIPSPPSSLYTTLQAQLIWPSSIYLADLISLGTIDVENKHVVELGSAAGLPGVVASIKGVKKVVSTDYGVKEVLDVLEDNFKMNSTKDDEDRWEVKGHCWGEGVDELLDAILPESKSTILNGHGPNVVTALSDEGHDPVGQTRTKFDLILAADVLWTTSTHQILLHSIISLMSKDGVTHITAGLHTGRGPLERFIRSAKDRGLVVEYKGEVRLKGDNSWEEYNQSMAVEGEEERGVVVWFTLR
ncbi:hypothetical protein V865_000476 [Kwoniella europaea PYCC6329]|uniref:Nicotinamide N-methyltransferase n=1 Tax=Kwoniella europaea PYCC6329 TaxID=1423913 RepID=A0AAX4K9N1_9TREE